MSNLWQRFDNIAKPEEVAEAKSSSTPVPKGRYTMRLEEAVAGESKNTGLPMAKYKFRIPSTNRIVFFNQLLQGNEPKYTVINVSQAVKFLEGLTGEEIDFVSLSQLAGIIESLPIGEEWEIDLSYAEKDIEQKYPKLKVIPKLDINTSEVDEEF